VADNTSVLRTYPYGGDSDYGPIETAPQIDNAATYPLTGPQNELSRSVAHSLALDSAGSYAAQALDQQLANDPRWQASKANALRVAAASNWDAPRVPTFHDIHGVGDALDYGLSKLGTLPSALPAIAGSVVGGAVGSLADPIVGPAGTVAGARIGAAIPSYYQARGAAALRQLQDPNMSAQDPEARAAAARNEGLVGGVIGSIAPGDIPLGKAGMLRDAAFMAGAGVGQTAVAQHEDKALGSQHQYTPADYIEAGISGAIPGAALGAIGHRATDPGTFEKVAAPVADAKSYVKDTYDRMREAAKDSANPGDFFNKVFRSKPEDQAAQDAKPDTEAPEVMNAEDPAEALKTRDQRRAERAASYAAELLKDPNTPDEVKARVSAMNGDYSKPEDMDFVTNTLVAQRAGEKLSTVINDFSSFVKGVAEKSGDYKTKAQDFLKGVGEAFDNAKDAAQDRIVKSNLQSIPDAQIKPLVQELAQRLGPKASEAPDLARKLVAAAVRLSPDAKITEESARRLQYLSDAVDGPILDTLTKVTGDNALRDALVKVREIPSAANDVRNSGGKSFLESMLKVPAEPDQLDQLARFVDDQGLKIDNLNKTAKKNVLTALGQFFGGTKNAQIVTEYYGKMRRAAFQDEAEKTPYVPEDEKAAPENDNTDTHLGDETVAADHAQFGNPEGEEAPVQYGFRHANSKLPFRTFASERLASGDRGSKSEIYRAIDNIKKENADDSAKAIPYSEYTKRQGLTDEQALNDMYRSIDQRIADHESKGGREEQINVLKGERSMIQHVADTQGPKAALDKYQVIERMARPDELTATQDDINTMKTGVDAHPETSITFDKPDGKTVKLSAESIWKTQRDKGGSGSKQELFSDGVASLMNKGYKPRGELSGITLDSATGEKITEPPAKGPMSAETKEASAQNQAEKASKRLFATKKAAESYQKNKSAFEAELKNYGGDKLDVVSSWLRTAEKAQEERPKDYELKSKIAVMEDWLDNEVNKREPLPSFEDLSHEISDRENAEGKYVDENSTELRDRFNEDTASALHAQADLVPGTKLEARLRKRADQSAVDRIADDKPAGTPPLRTKSGEIKPDAKARMTEALHDVFVNGNYERLDTPEKTLRAAAMAKGWLADLAQRDPSTLTEGEKALRDKLTNEPPDLKKMLADQNPTPEQTRLMDEISKQSAMGEGAKISKADRKKIVDEIRRVRGNDVNIAFRKFADIGGSGRWSMNADKTSRLIEIAATAADPLGAAWHESLHDFFGMLNEDVWGRQIKKDLMQSASAPQVMGRLRELLANHPDAREQLESSPEERAAYMYQFWAHGELRVGPTGTGILNRIRQLFRDLFGIVSRDQHVEDLLTALHDGRFSEPGTVAEVLADLNKSHGDRPANKIERINPDLVIATRKMMSVAPDRLRAYQNEHLNTLANKFSSETGKLGFIQRRFQQGGIQRNRLAKILENTTAVERRAAIDELQRMQPQSPLALKIRDMLDELHDYMSKADVRTYDKESKNWVPLRFVKDYFPRDWDAGYIRDHRADFAQLLVSEGHMSPVQASKTIDAIIYGTNQMDLVENEHSLGYTPMADAVLDRKFKFITKANADKFAQYQSKDLTDAMTNYIHQAVHRAEYARDFGNDGEVIKDLVRRSGIVRDTEIKDIGVAIQALEGSIGQGKISASTKNMMAGAMTLSNLVALPLALFSQMVDPVVLAARSGRLRDAGDAYLAAIKKLVGSKDIPGDDLAHILGIVTQDNVLQAMGNVYGSAYMGKNIRRINQVFFKYNGMEGWNQAMRTAATAAGERFLIAKAKANDAKALRELGLTAADVKTGADGRLDVSDPKIQDAMFRFVDEAVLRPSASHRPAWMSDPRFMLVAHLKQFTFAMNDVILKRATRELENGNMTPWAILSLTVPVIIASDMVKMSLTGTVPQTWGFKDYLAHGVRRSGLYGLGDFGVQAMQGVSVGTSLPGEGLLGPTLETALDIMRWIGGDPLISTHYVLNHTVPGYRYSH
jgi:hypothetical protein